MVSPTNINQCGGTQIICNRERSIDPAGEAQLVGILTVILWAEGLLIGFLPSPIEGMQETARECFSPSPFFL